VEEIVLVNKFPILMEADSVQFLTSRSQQILI